MTQGIQMMLCNCRNLRIFAFWNKWLCRQQARRPFPFHFGAFQLTMTGPLSGQALADQIKQPLKLNPETLHVRPTLLLLTRSRIARTDSQHSTTNKLNKEFYDRSMTGL
jgi:hypothetical protein